jgi:hypothetical protein
VKSIECDGKYYHTERATADLKVRTTACEK